MKRNVRHHRHILSPLLTTLLGMRPLQDGQVFPASGATRVIDRHSSFYPIPVNAEGSEYIIVDAGMDNSGQALKDFLAAKQVDLGAVKAVFLTHDHSDHVGALHALPGSVGVYIGKADEAVLEGQEASEGPLPGLFDKLAHKHLGAVTNVHPQIITDGQRVTVGTVTVRAFAMEGHTPGSMAYLIGQDVNGPYDLFVGDGLDYKKNGSVANSAPPFTVDTKESADSIVELTHELLTIKDKIQAVIPAHSGNGTFSAEQAFRSK